MKNRVLKIALAALAAVLTAAAITVPGAAPALAANVIGEIDLGWQGSGNTLYAHAHGSYIETTSLRFELQHWATTNGQRWTNNFGNIVPVAEIELVTAQGTECINLGTDDKHFYLDSCVHGDNNELFWFRQYGSNNHLYNLVNVEASMINKANHINSLGYMTGQCFGPPGCFYSPVENLTFGSGSLGLWWVATVPVT